MSDASERGVELSRLLEVAGMLMAKFALVHYRARYTGVKAGAVCLVKILTSTAALLGGVISVEMALVDLGVTDGVQW